MRAGETQEMARSDRTAPFATLGRLNEVNRTDVGEGASEVIKLTTPRGKCCIRESRSRRFRLWLIVAQIILNVVKLEIAVLQLIALYAELEILEHRFFLSTTYQIR